MGNHETTPADSVEKAPAAALAGEADKALRDIGGDATPAVSISQDPTPVQGESKPDSPAAEAQAPLKKGRGRPPKEEKTDKSPGADKSEQSGKPRPPKEEKAVAKAEPAPPAKPAPPRKSPRHNGKDKIVYISLDELHPFKNHPFGVREDSEMKSLVESVKDKGVNQPALVRPRPDGGYEIVAGHRRQKASELAGYTDIPCIVREMTDDEAVLAMTDDNLRQRTEILPSEKAVSLKMQVDAIKHQGERFKGVAGGDVGKRSVDIVGERNNMSAKQVQRYISLTKLVPDIMKMVDEKQIGLTQAVELSVIKRTNQNLIAVSIEGEQSKPSLSQAQRLRELDQKEQLNGDVIDGILSQEKKEVDKVIINSAELDKYFGKDKTPREMKDQIIKLLDDWAGKEKERPAPEKPDR